MGFSTLLDIIGSMIIGGMLLMILFRLNNATVENTYNNGGELIVQESLVEVVQLIEHDFRKIGYCADWNKIPFPSRSILMADSNNIHFLTDVDSDGEVDTMHYYLGPTSALLNTPNPRDKILYRVVNNNPEAGSNLGVTEFSLLYFNSLGDTISFPITTPAEIYTMQINITVESVAAYDENYASGFWRQIRLAARNLRNR